MSPRVALLAGGVGGAKLADGLYRALPHGDLRIVANPGDDFELHGLTICPDHDTLLYTLAGLGDRARGWGLSGETWNALEQFGKIGAPDWFKIGDRDLALHVHRTALLKAGGRLTDVNRALQRRLGLADAPILMATDDPIRTRLRTPEGWMEFQPWFVGAQAQPEVLEVAFDGEQRAHVSREVAEAFHEAELIAIAPSNPLISVAPILAVGGIRDAIRTARARGVPVVGVSPIVAGKAIKGPADRMLSASGLPASPIGVARALPDLFDTLIVEASDLDEALREEIAPLVPRVVGAETVMHDSDARLRLAQRLLKVAGDGG